MMRILTFDIEDWFHLLDHDRTQSHVEWKKYQTRIYRNMEKILALLEERGQKTTFFILGWMARQYPDIIRQIADLGHEIGSHSDMHQLVYTQTPEQFRDDLEYSIKSLEDVTGKKITIYRAPGFSIIPETPWVFETLLSFGIEADSSLFITRRSHGGYHSFPLFQPCYIETHGMRLKEFPVVPFRYGIVRVAFSGGGYFRLFPYAVISFFTKRTPYLMTYFHYRDFDHGQPLIPGLSPFRRFKAYVGIKGAAKKLSRLLDDFSLVDIRTADSCYDWSKAPVVYIEDGGQIRYEE